MSSTAERPSRARRAPVARDTSISYAQIAGLPATDQNESSTTASSQSGNIRESNRPRRGRGALGARRRGRGGRGGRARGYSTQRRVSTPVSRQSSLEISSDLEDDEGNRTRSSSPTASVVSEEQSSEPNSVQPSLPADTACTEEEIQAIFEYGSQDLNDTYTADPAGELVDQLAAAVTRTLQYNLNFACSARETFLPLGCRVPSSAEAGSNSSRASPDMHHPHTEPTAVENDNSHAVYQQIFVIQIATDNAPQVIIENRLPYRDFWPKLHIFLQDISNINVWPQVPSHWLIAKNTYLVPLGHSNPPDTNSSSFREFGSLESVQHDQSEWNTLTVCRLPEQEVDAVEREHGDPDKINCVYNVLIYPPGFPVFGISQTRSESQPSLSIQSPPIVDNSRASTSVSPSMTMDSGSSRQTSSSLTHPALTHPVIDFSDPLVLQQIAQWATAASSGSRHTALASSNPNISTNAGNTGQRISTSELASNVSPNIPAISSGVSSSTSLSQNPLPLNTSGTPIISIVTPEPTVSQSTSSSPVGDYLQRRWSQEHKVLDQIPKYGSAYQEVVLVRIVDRIRLALDLQYGDSQPSITVPGPFGAPLNIHTNDIISWVCRSRAPSSFKRYRTNVSILKDAWTWLRSRTIRTEQQETALQQLDQMLSETVFLQPCTMQDVVEGRVSHAYFIAAVGWSVADALRVCKPLANMAQSG
ncbi:hypothetical protein K435DRAFT_865129 [Dendrothele bispora CBS 962.96]|uniref:Uncharacterized protein n=1 Tax=Dendrothele bispora (strain CBS 962.96) TaxID=1314807 RepID=A0A4S8LKQ0_DENBC|nr:hypothetical protein K435DRAFT_865129 [Dendrothele bispora CBS 962.96]